MTSAAGVATDSEVADRRYRAQRRARILDAMTALACERGFAGASVTLVCARAKASRRAFYEEFDGREACFLAVLDDGLRLAIAVIDDAFERAGAAGEPGDPKQAFAALREALAALLALMDDRPQLARIWMIESQAAGVWALAHRERNVQVLTERIVARWGSPPGTKEIVPAAVMASLLGLIQRHMLSDSCEPLLVLLGPLMGVVSTPYLDADAVADESRRAREHSHWRLAELSARNSGGGEYTEDPLPSLLRNPHAPRPRQCLLYVAEHPGQSNRQIASALGISSHTQASMLLCRLLRLRLLEKRSLGPGRPNQWRLTQLGGAAAAILSRQRPSGNRWHSSAVHISGHE